VLNELAQLIHGSALTVTGATLADGFAGAEAIDRDVIASFSAPIAAEGGIAVVRGSLAPDGALIKRSAATPALLSHRGPALVFEDIYDVAARIDDPSLDVTAESVLVLRNAGPKGGPGMPEWGQLPIPKKLLARGVTDMVRISDARMSGTAFGTVVLHVAPEAAAGGPLRAVQDGDPIVLDVDAQRLDLDIPAAEVARRLDQLGPAEPKYRRGYGALYLEHVLQANEGCDFDFLRGRGETEPLGLLSGWIGGW
jgi:dihydroxyacid dehydratase/phosphogluconate dehydratase